MNTSMIINKEIAFEANAAQVWDLLTNPAMTKQYMFGCEVLSDWQIGSVVDWKGKTETGEDIVYVTGEVLAYETDKYVKLTMFDPNMGLADVPENYVHLTYELAEQAGGTLLKIGQVYDASAESAEKRFAESDKGWDMIIPVMKKLIS